MPEEKKEEIKTDKTETKQTGNDMFAMGLGQMDISTFMIVQDQIKRSSDTAPAYIPKTYKDQFALYKNGTTYRLYVYLEGTWRYCSLT